MGKEAFNKKKYLLPRSKDSALKKRIVKSLVRSVTLYAAETWTLSKIDIKKLEAFEMWVWRRMERISYTEHVSNEAVLKQIEEKRTLIATIHKRQKSWIGHVLRGQGWLRYLFEG